LQRTRLLLHIVDIAPFDPESDPVREARAIVEELRKYDEELFEKPRWLVLNKADLLSPEDREQTIRQFVERFGWNEKTFIISALNGEGCQSLIYAINEHLEQSKRLDR
jgi:GTP-binding protein